MGWDGISSAGAHFSFSIFGSLCQRNLKLLFPFPDNATFLRLFQMLFLLSKQNNHCGNGWSLYRGAVQILPLCGLHLICFSNLSQSFYNSVGLNWPLTGGTEIYRMYHQNDYGIDYHCDQNSKKVHSFRRITFQVISENIQQIPE